MIEEDYARYLLDEAQSDIAALHQFKILYDDSDKSLHLFFEGEEDGLFYVPEIRRRNSAVTLHIYDCGGKSNVVDVRDDLLRSGYDLEPCLFFIDRDYDDFFESQANVDDHTFITEFYSVENELCHEISAAIILGDLVRISRADPEFTRLMEDFRVSQIGFYRSIRPLIAWILAAREHGLDLNLSNTKGLKDIFQVGEAGSTSLKNDGFRVFCKRVKKRTGVPPVSAVIRWYRALSALPPKVWVRGKYEIWFFHASMVKLIDEGSARRKSSGGKAYRIPEAVRAGNLFEVLGGRVPAADNLINYIRRKVPEPVQSTAH